MTAPARRRACPHGDTTCPCPDGAACHYEPAGDTTADRCPRTGTGTVGCACKPCPQCGWPIEHSDLYNRCDTCRAANRARRRRSRSAA